MEATPRFKNYEIERARKTLESDFNLLGLEGFVHRKVFNTVLLFRSAFTNKTPSI
jgi:hypothetical protein